jgi:hypothetical protein
VFLKAVDRFNYHPDFKYDGYGTHDQQGRIFINPKPRASDIARSESARPKFTARF